MLYQEIATNYPSVSSAGESHNNRRHTSLFATAYNGVDLLQPGVAQVVTGIYTPTGRASYGSHTRLQLETPSAVNLVPDNKIVIVCRDLARGNSFVVNRVGQTTATSTSLVYERDAMVRVAEDDEIYVVCEKAIDPTNPVYIRVANPDTSGTQGIGFFTDVADGTNTVEIDNTFRTRIRWIGEDSFSFLNALDPNITAAIDRRRMGLSQGFAIVPISIATV